MLFRYNLPMKRILPWLGVLLFLGSCHVFALELFFFAFSFIMYSLLLTTPLSKANKGLKEVSTPRARQVPFMMKL